MRAAFYTEPGIASAVLQIGELPTPTAGPGEVRVKLASSGINPSDVKSRSGSVDRSKGAPLIVPHSDGAGIIDQVGARVDAARLGERVWVYNGQWQRTLGTAAQFIALPAEQAQPLPANTSFRAGACLGIPALTAWLAVHHTGCGEGTAVLVQGGAGAVGHYAIQFAKLRGAIVLATVSSARKAASASAAGADHVIDYRQEDVPGTVRRLTGGRGVDAVIEVDFSSNAAHDFGVLASHGTIVVYGASEDTATLALRQLRGLNARLQFMRIYDAQPAVRNQANAELYALLARGALQHQIAAAYPLEQVAAAHDAVGARDTLGNIVLDID